MMSVKYYEKLKEHKKKKQKLGKKSEDFIGKFSKTTESR